MKKKKKIIHKWTYKEIVLKNGGYKLGPQGSFFLSEKAFLHIIDGEFSERLIEKDGKRTGKKEKILSGGLHTYQAWINFKNLRGDIVPLLYYNSPKDNLWYYARRLKNGVITLRIPREVFQNNAANITKFPDLFYKSGYLWKTLFPKGKTNSEILSIIDEALHYINKEESGNNIFIGYALRSHPFTALKVRIQCRGNNILSAFPTWDQPMTGNTGKAYSHADSISLISSLSTELFDDEVKLNKSNIYNSAISVNSLVSKTPSFILKRQPLPELGKIDSWNSTRESIVESIANQSTEETIICFKEYLSDSIICKEGFHIQLGAYNNIHSEVDSNISLFNAISIHQNIIEVLTVINYYDKKNRTLHLIEAITHILQNKIIYTGALDNWNTKRLHNKILDFVIEYHDNKIIPLYINLLSKSPIKGSLYIEFDIANVCFKKDLDLSQDNDAILFGVINMPPLNNKITFECFKNYLLYNLGENYLLNFDFKNRNIIINEIIDNQGVNYKKMIMDCLRLTSFEDLIFFSEKLRLLAEKIITKKITGFNNESLAIIVKDYFRTQAAQRFKILLLNPDFVLDAENHFDFDSEEYKTNTIIKHERRVNVITLDQFLEHAIVIAEYLNNKKLISEIKMYKTKVWMEKPPLPKGIPKYIEHWYNQKDQSWKNDKSLRIIPFE